MKKIISIIVLFFLFAGVSMAQESGKPGYKPGSYYTFTWDVGFPVGDMNKWAGQTSPAGWDFGGRYLLQKGLTVGFNIGWQRIGKIYDDETFTIPEKGLAINAENYRLTWMVPFQAVVAYHLKPASIISPYIGLGIGGDYAEHHLLIQEYDVYETRWDFALAPEIGVLAKFGAFSNWGAIIAVNYKWTTNYVDIYDTKFNNLAWFNLRVGLAVTLR